MLDPCEEAFSAIKQRVKMGLSQRTDELTATDHLPWGMKTAKRQAVLLETIVASLEVVTPAKAAAWWFHSLSFAQQCFAHEDL